MKTFTTLFGPWAPQCHFPLCLEACWGNSPCDSGAQLARAARMQCKLPWKSLDVGKTAAKANVASVIYRFVTGQSTPKTQGPRVYNFLKHGIVDKIWKQFCRKCWQTCLINVGSFLLRLSFEMATDRLGFGVGGFGGLFWSGWVCVGLFVCLLWFSPILPVCSLCIHPLLCEQATPRAAAAAASERLLCLPSPLCDGLKSLYCVVSGRDFDSDITNVINRSFRSF